MDSIRIYLHVMKTKPLEIANIYYLLEHEIFPFRFHFFLTAFFCLFCIEIDLLVERFWELSRCQIENKKLICYNIWQHVCICCCCFFWDGFYNWNAEIQIAYFFCHFSCFQVLYLLMETVTDVAANI